MRTLSALLVPHSLSGPVLPPRTGQALETPCGNMSAGKAESQAGCVCRAQRRPQLPQPPSGQDAMGQLLCPGVVSGEAIPPGGHILEESDSIKSWLAASVETLLSGEPFPATDF